MIADVVVLLVLAACVAVLVVGLSAPRTRRLAMIGLVGAGTAAGFAIAALARGGTRAHDVAAGLAAITAGLAHGVGFSLVPLPAGRTSWRFVLVPLGMWCGTFASIWFFYGYAGLEYVIPTLVLAAATVASWVALPFFARRRTHVTVAGRAVACVRFACPRCGTRVDFARGIMPCTDCGLFLRLDWSETRADGAAHDSSVGGSDRSRPDDRSGAAVPVSADTTSLGVRFDCPGCGRNARWPRGETPCPSCGRRIALHWNVHA